MKANPLNLLQSRAWILVFLGLAAWFAQVRADEGWSNTLWKPRVWRNNQQRPEKQLDIQDLYTVQSDVLAVRIDSGKTIYGQQRVYQAQSEDAQSVDEAGNVWVERAGQPLGALVGPEKNILRRFDRLEGAPLDVRWASRARTYRLVSEQDPHYQTGQRPRQVFRKSKPSDRAQLTPWDAAWPQSHVLYLQWPYPLQPGATYRLEVVGASGQTKAHTFHYRPERQRSEAVHVSQVGFHPQDAKIAFLSTWMGDGGGLDYSDDLDFWVMDAQSQQSVYRGDVTLRRRPDEAEDLRDRNYNHTPVYELRFDAVTEPGTYRVCVETVGCSFDFAVADDVWAQAFDIATQGIFHQRSGIALGPPWTSLVRSRPFHPDDGQVIYQSKTSLLETGNGLHYEWDNFDQLVAGKTLRKVRAWGGYFDAGDWDRRIQHLELARLLLELQAIAPQTQTLALAVPESGNDRPDLLDEALWGIDFFRRLQLPKGGIRGGIESAEHPRWGETSWQETLDVMAYGPDVWSSYVYAGVAARAAGQMQARWPEQAGIYRESALRAIAYAEQEYGALSDAEQRALHHGVRDARNLAAVELWRLTQDPGWHDLFLETTVLQQSHQPLYRWEHQDQRDAAFVYLRLAPEQADAQIQAQARVALLAEADASLALGQQTAFGWTRMDPMRPVGWGGSFGNPKVTTLIRAHALTQDEKYLKAALLACQFSTGANPLNMTYTTGLGQRFPRNPLVIDQRALGQAPPSGLTVYGPMDPGDSEAIATDWHAQQVAGQVYPKLWQWPATESYFDVYLFPAVTEFTVHETLAPVAYAWGYFAHRTVEF